MTPTPSQLRALELFQLMESLPAREDMVGVFAVARCLSDEGICFSSGSFRRFALSSQIPRICVLDIDGAMVCAKGVYEDWGDVARAHGINDEIWRLWPITDFDPRDDDWLGPDGPILVRDAVAGLTAMLQQQYLDDAAPHSPGAHHAPRRF